MKIRTYFPILVLGAVIISSSYISTDLARIIVTVTSLGYFLFLAYTLNRSNDLKGLAQIEHQLFIGLIVLLTFFYVIAVMVIL